MNSFLKVSSNTGRNKPVYKTTLSMGLFLRQTQINRMNFFFTLPLGFWSFLFFPTNLHGPLFCDFQRQSSGIINSGPHSTAGCLSSSHCDPFPSPRETPSHRIIRNKRTGKEGVCKYCISAHLVRQYATLLLHECYTHKSHEQSCEVCKYLSKFYWQGNCKIMLFQPFSST